MHNVDVRNVSLGQIQYFLKVAEYKNITKAAEYFNLSQPTLSKKLKSLEVQLDLQLFYRTAKSVTLTPAGKYLYESWLKQVTQMEDGIQYAHMLQRGYTKSIVVGCLDSFQTEKYILPVLNRFSESHSDIQIRIESDAAQDIRDMLIHDEVDVILSIQYDFEEKLMEQMVCKLIGATPHCACMRKDNPLAAKEEISISDLKQSDFVCISPQYLPEYVHMVRALCEPQGFSPNISNYVTSANSLTLNIRTNHDVFICDKYYADMAEEHHVRIPIADTKSGMALVWKRDSKKAYLAQLIQALEQQIQ